MITNTRIKYLMMTTLYPTRLGRRKINHNLPNNTVKLITDIPNIILSIQNLVSTTTLISITVR